MTSDHLDRVLKLRGMLNLAGPENSRMVAATIGRQLEIIVIETGGRREVAGATDAVREALSHQRDILLSS